MKTWNFCKNGKILKVKKKTVKKASIYSVLFPRATRRPLSYKGRSWPKTIFRGALNLLPLLFLIVLIFGPSPSMGQDQENSIKWDELGSVEKQILAPLQEKWDKLSPEKQNRLNNGAMKWHAMSPEQQKNFKQKLQAWKQKTPDEKLIIRNQFQRFHNLPEKEKQTLRDTYGAFKSLSLDEQKSLLTLYSKADQRDAGPN